MNPLKLLTLVLVACGLCPFVLAQDVILSPTTPVSDSADVFHLLDEARAQNEDRDLRFVRDLIGFNQAALESAKSVLKTSYDADIRMMAGDSMKLHDAQLRTLKAWMSLHGPQPQADASATVVAPETSHEPMRPEDSALNTGTPETFEDDATNEE